MEDDTPDSAMNSVFSDDMSVPGLTSAASSTVPSHHRASSSGYTASASSHGHSGRRDRSHPKVVAAVGLEEEVEFGSDEDLMDNVGEIKLSDHGHDVWYPGSDGKLKQHPAPAPAKSKGKGKYDQGISHTAQTKSHTYTKIPTNSNSAPRQSVSKHQSTDSTSSSSGKWKFGNSKSKHSEKVRGIGETKLVSMDEIMSSSHSDLERIETNKTGFGSIRSSTSGGYRAESVRGDGGSMRDVKREKTKGKTMFSKLFKGSSASVSSPSIHSSHSMPTNVNAKASMTSLGAMSDSSRSRSILVSPVPEHAQADIPSLPPTPALSEISMGKPLPAASHPSSQQYRRPSSSTAVPTRSPFDISNRDSEDLQNFIAHPNNSRERLLPAETQTGMAISTNTISNQSREPTSIPQVSMNETDHLLHLLLPSFPAGLSAIEGITILSTMVMRKSTSLNSSRPMSGSKKPIWQSHKLVLTSFKLNTKPEMSPSSSSPQTVAHLHLFALARTRSRPGTSHSNHSSSTMTPYRDSIGSGDTARQSGEFREVERRQITQMTYAGVWPNADVSEADKGRKWVMRIVWGDEDWLCDMPSKDTLFDWIKQIQGYALSIQSESFGSSPPLLITTARRASTPGVPEEALLIEQDDDDNLDGEKQQKSRRGSGSGHLSPHSSQPNSRRQSFNRNIPAAAPPPQGPLPTAPTSSTIQTNSPPELTQADVPDLAALNLTDHAPVALGEAVAPAVTTPGSISNPTVPSDTESTPGLLAAPSGFKSDPPTPGCTTPGGADSEAEESIIGQAIDFPTPPASIPSPSPAVKLNYSPSSQPPPSAFQQPRHVPLADPQPMSQAQQYQAEHLGQTGPYMAGSKPRARFAESENGDDKADAASITSSATGSTMSLARRRLRSKAAAMDLMAEFSSRPEANFDESSEVLAPINEDRPKRIRFAG